MRISECIVGKPLKKNDPQQLFRHFCHAECEVRSTVDVGSHTLFVGEVVDAGFQKEEETPVLRMEDTRMNYGG